MNIKRSALIITNNIMSLYLRHDKKSDLFSDFSSVLGSNGARQPVFHGVITHSKVLDEVKRLNGLPGTTVLVDGKSFNPEDTKRDDLIDFIQHVRPTITFKMPGDVIVVFSCFYEADGNHGYRFTSSDNDVFPSDVAYSSSWCADKITDLISNAYSSYFEGNDFSRTGVIVFDMREAIDEAMDIPF